MNDRPPPQLPTQKQDRSAMHTFVRLQTNLLLYPYFLSSQLSTEKIQASPYARIAFLFSCIRVQGVVISSFFLPLLYLASFCVWDTQIHDRGTALLDD